MSHTIAPAAAPLPEPRRRPSRSSTAVTRPPLVQSHKPPRDPVIDAVRTGCMFVVVALHALLVGVWRTDDGGLATRVALTDLPWFPALTWVVQVMPLFFIAGGFAGAAQWRSMRAEGASATDYILGRVRRLAVPAAVMITVVGTGLGVARGLSDDATSAGLLDEAAYRIGQPLWFLAVYIGVTSLVPFMMRLHERFRLVVPSTLLLGALAVDLVRMHSGVEGIGFANLAFVWLFAQQLGFWLADARAGHLRTGNSRPRIGLFAGLFAALAAIVFLSVHGWSLDLLASLNPPNTVLALLAVVQLCVLRLAYPRLRVLVTRPAVARVVGRAGSCAITVYLWHMPIIMGLVTVLWAAGAPLPPVHGLAWWATRGLWLAGVATCVIPVGLALAPVERWVPRLPAVFAAWRARPWHVALFVSSAAALVPLLAIAGVTTALLGGLSAALPTTAAGLCLWAAVLLSDRRRRLLAS